MESKSETIPLFKPFIAPTVATDLAATLKTGMITQGHQVEMFEKELGEFLGTGTGRVVTVNSATSGLTLALRILKEEIEFNEEQDEVLAPALTCFATTAAILANRMKIKWIDVDPHTLNPSLEDIKKKISSKTKIIVIVHWGGTPVDLDRLNSIQDLCYEKYGFHPLVVEDCAHAFGATYQGTKLGTHGNTCVYSFQAIKHLTTGDGGAIVFPYERLPKKARVLRWYGIDREEKKSFDERLEDDIPAFGYKFHMNDLNASMGRANLPHIPKMLKNLKVNAEYLRSRLSRVPGLKMQTIPVGAESANWLFTMRIPGDKKKFIEYMKKEGIQTSQVHARNDKNSCVAEFQSELPNLDAIEKELICIPVGWWLSLSDLSHICDCVEYYFDM